MPAYSRTALIGNTSDDATPVIQGAWSNVDTAAGTAVTNTTTETAAASFTFAGGTLQDGNVIEFEAIIRVTADNSTNTIDVVLYYGASALTTAICTTDQVDAAATDIMVFKGSITIRDADSSGTYTASTWTKAEPSATGAGTLEHHYTQTTSVDFTADTVLSVGIAWSAASTGNSAQSEVFNVRVS